MLLMELANIHKGTVLSLKAILNIIRESKQFLDRMDLLEMVLLVPTVVLKPAVVVSNVVSLDKQKIGDQNVQISYVYY